MNRRTFPWPIALGAPVLVASIIVWGCSLDSSPNLQDPKDPAAGGAGTGVTGGQDGGGAMTGDGGQSPSGGESSLGGSSPSGGGTNSGGTFGVGGTSDSSTTAAPVFDGESGYVEIPDADELSQPFHDAYTVEAWIRPDSTSMPNTEGTGYVHFLGKGAPNQHEWVSRMYQDGNSEGRANRISFYSFNLTGGLGAGSYFQQTVTPGDWIFYAGQFDNESTYIFKNGVQEDSDLLSGYSITPGNGTAPVRIGTRDLGSYFQGSIARVAIYGSRLSQETLAAHYSAASAEAYDALVMSEGSLVGYWKLNELSGDIAYDATGSHHGSYHGGVQLNAAVFRD